MAAFTSTGEREEGREGGTDNEEGSVKKAKGGEEINEI